MPPRCGQPNTSWQLAEHFRSNRNRAAASFPKGKATRTWDRWKIKLFLPLIDCRAGCSTIRRFSERSNDFDRKYSLGSIFAWSCNDDSRVPRNEFKTIAGDDHGPRNKCDDDWRSWLFASLYIGRRRSNRRDCHLRRGKDDGKVSFYRAIVLQPEVRRARVQMRHFRAWVVRIWSSNFKSLKGRSEGLSRGLRSTGQSLSSSRRQVLTYSTITETFSKKESPR